MKRALRLSLNPTGIGSAAAAVYAAVVMLWNAGHHHAVIDPQVIIAALSAAGFLYTRFKVTPVADPRDGNGAPLTAAPPVPAPVMTVSTSGGSAAVTPAKKSGADVQALISAPGYSVEEVIAAISKPGAYGIPLPRAPDGVPPSVPSPGPPPRPSGATPAPPAEVPPA